MPTEAVIFDMDGLLIDSEPLWRLTEQEIFATVGINLTEDMCFETMGLSTREVVEYWYRHFDCDRGDIGEVAGRLEDRMVEMIREEGEPLPGVYALLEHCRQAGLTLAIASGSVDRLIEAVVERLALKPYFSLYHSAQHEAAGKPDPAVYLGALRRLDLKAGQCVAFEDSLRGVQSAKAAGLYTVAVPEPGINRREFVIADKVLHSLEQALQLPWLNGRTLKLQP